MIVSASSVIAHYIEKNLPRRVAWILHKGKSERKFLRIISIVLFMWYSAIHIIHYDFYCCEEGKALEASPQEQRPKGAERVKYFPSSHDRCKSRVYFPAYMVCSPRECLSDFHRRDTKANIYVDLSMFYFVICCGARICATWNFMIAFFPAAGETIFMNESRSWNVKSWNL